MFSVLGHRREKFPSDRLDNAAAKDLTASQARQAIPTASDTQDNARSGRPLASGVGAETIDKQPEGVGLNPWTTTRALPYPPPAPDFPAVATNGPSEPEASEMLRASSNSALLKQVTDPDTHATQADRERAIELRWILRDIKADRLKLSPASAPDLDRKSVV